MISKKEALQKRGLIMQGEATYFHGAAKEQLYETLNAADAAERTAAVVTLRKICAADDRTYLKLLMNRLRYESALYTRIEICKTLEQGNDVTADFLCGYLGSVGRNQHKKVPDRVSRKKSYPLPRDIIARSLGRMDISVIGILMQHLKSDDRCKISELLDAIGYMVFYHPELATEANFLLIRDTLERFAGDDLLIWKTAMCCSAFPLAQSIELLTDMTKVQSNATIIQEAERSLKLIQR